MLLSLLMRENDSGYVYCSENHMDKITGTIIKEKSEGEIAANGHAMNGLITSSNRKFEPVSIPPAKVHETLSKHILADGFDLVIDLKNSQGSWLQDARSGKRFL